MELSTMKEFIRVTSVVIQEHFSQNLDNLLLNLYDGQVGLLTEFEYKECSSIQQPNAKCMHLLDCLGSKDLEHVESFIRAVDKCSRGQKSFIEYLKSAHDQVLQGIKKEKGVDKRVMRKKIMVKKKDKDWGLPQDQDEDGGEDESLPKQVKKAFIGKSDVNDTIGFVELQQLLNDHLCINKFDGFDSASCSLVLDYANGGTGERRVTMNGFIQICDFTGELFGIYNEFDIDESGSLDPFELRDALDKAGFFKISYQIFSTLHKLLGKKESQQQVMDFKGFLLCVLLLKRLQQFHNKRDPNKKELYANCDSKRWLREQFDAAAADGAAAVKDANAKSKNNSSKFFQAARSITLKSTTTK